MRRIIFTRKIVSAFFRFLSHSNDGSDGYDWKVRDLQDKRALAMNYIGDIKKRVPIHDAIRIKAQINNKALDHNDGPSSLFEPISSLTEHEETYDDVRKYMETVINGLMDEFSGDILDSIHESDASLLKDEFFGDEQTRSDCLQKWLKFRREVSDYQSYLSVPISEQNAWSAWYLRHVKGNFSNS
ncbi:unnamed protein product [Phytomonas sp. EM1]|nr:unnamed protein product [Phytomonas sp. EM1]|eukprot:CCW63244.1 unnamed protein product [Phytomonas sp. isolate EM1]